MSFLIGLLNVAAVVSSLFLICLVLIQRGKGGGLAGAFGGMGGSSAFGTKAGDTFTRITMITAGVWIGLLMLLVLASKSGPSSAFVDTSLESPQSVPVTPGGSASTGTRGEGKATEGAGGSRSALPAEKPTGSAPAPGSSKKTP